MYLLARAAKDDWKGEDHWHIQAFVLLALLLVLEQRMLCLYYQHFAGLLAPMHARTRASHQWVRVAKGLTPPSTGPQHVCCAGVIDWCPFIPGLFSHMLACFHVPVGTATANCPTALGAPHKAALLFGNKLDQVMGGAGGGGGYQHTE